MTRQEYGTVESVDVWSVAKVSLPFYAMVVAVVIGAGVLLWAVLVGSGSTEEFERFVVKDVGYSSFRFLPDQMFTAGVKSGLIVVVAGTAFNVLMAILFNILSDLVGGIRLLGVERPGRARVRAPLRSGQEGSSQA